MKELRAATKIFTTILGEGAFGKVYKAEFPEGTWELSKWRSRKGQTLLQQLLLRTNMPSYAEFTTVIWST
jgi:hypothetical protein